MGKSLDTCEVTVNGHCVQDLLNAGCSMSMLKSYFVTNVDYANCTSVQCVHGDVKQYPRADVIVELQQQMYLKKVVIVDSLPTDMILGQDFPVLHEPLMSRKTDNIVTPAIPVSCSVNIQLQAWAGIQPLLDLDDSLLQGGTKGPRKSHRHRDGLRNTMVPTSQKPQSRVSLLMVGRYQVTLQNYKEKIGL